MEMLNYWTVKSQGNDYIAPPYKTSYLIVIDVIDCSEISRLIKVKREHPVYHTFTVYAMINALLFTLQNIFHITIYMYILSIVGISFSFVFSLVVFMLWGFFRFFFLRFLDPPRFFFRHLLMHLSQRLWAFLSVPVRLAHGVTENRKTLLGLVQVLCSRNKQS